MSYVGRFAPSPTGGLHQGSLLAALASYLDARHHGGKWLLRIEDLDPPREDPHAPALIIRQLRAFHLHWDGEVLYQSARLPAYDAALAQLAEQGRVYPCTCARGAYGQVYPGTCDGRYAEPPPAPHALRLRVAGSARGSSGNGITPPARRSRRAGACGWQDRLLGVQRFDMRREVGDFIIKRKDGLHAYQLAVVVDDIFQQITHLVRGADLLDSTPRQLSLYQALGAQPPSYLHLPVLLDRFGFKLSKQTQAPLVSASDIPAQLRRLLALLGQPIPSARAPSALLAAAARNWDPARIPAQPTLPAPRS